MRLGCGTKDQFFLGHDTVAGMCVYAVGVFFFFALYTYDLISLGAAQRHIRLETEMRGPLDIGTELIYQSRTKNCTSHRVGVSTMDWTGLGLRTHELDQFRAQVQALQAQAQAWAQAWTQGQNQAHAQAQVWV